MFGYGLTIPARHTNTKKFGKKKKKPVNFTSVRAKQNHHETGNLTSGYLPYGTDTLNGIAKNSTPVDKFIYSAGCVVVFSTP